MKAAPPGSARGTKAGSWRTCRRRASYRLRRFVAQLSDAELERREGLVQYLAEQHFISKAMPLEELFVPVDKTLR